jgi:hypothetical protein
MVGVTSVAVSILLLPAPQLRQFKVLATSP